MRANVYKSLLLNSVSLLSIYVFDLLLQPLVRDQQKWFHRNIGWFYQILWLFPVLSISLYLNVSVSSAMSRYYLPAHARTTFFLPYLFIGNMVYDNCQTYLSATTWWETCCCPAIILHGDIKGHCNVCVPCCDGVHHCGRFVCSK